MGSRERLTFAAVAVLLLGLAAGTLIYAFADEPAPEGAGYIIVNGEAYPVSTLTSKRYVRDMEQMGGKMLLLMDEFERWFSGLWRGKTLGLTIGGLSVATSLVLVLVARALPPDERGPG